MTRIRLLAVAVAVLAWGSELYGRRPLDRDGLLTALQQRAATGVPRHLDHDEGEELQAAVTAALAADPGDNELERAATRASFVLGPRVGPVISDHLPTATIEVLAPLSLSWKTAAAGTIDVSLDGSGWRHAADVQPGVDRIQVPLPKAAARQGFHVVRFRASLRFTGVPGSTVDRETRDLPARTYGVTGTSAAGQRVAAFLNSAARANAGDLDPALPGVTLDTWLRTVASTGDAPPPIWTAHWCEDRPGAGDQPPSSVCARAMVGSAPDGGHGELWVRVATADVSGDRPTWTPVGPSVEGVDLVATPARSTVTLPELPFALRSMEDDWPRAALSLDARAITLSPAAPRRGEPVAIRTELRNSGRADLYGMTIDVLAFDTPERLLLHRRFVRSVPAGGSVVVETTTAFPLGYGGVLVSVMPLTDHVVFAPLMADGSDGFSHAARLVHPELAPRGYVDRVRASVGCKPGCTNVR